jgi:hypothetical protein
MRWGAWSSFIFREEGFFAQRDHAHGGEYMSLIETSRAMELKKRVDHRMAMYYSVVFTILIFVFLLFADFLAALIGGTVSFVGLYVLIRGLLSLQRKGATKKLQAVDTTYPYLDVTFQREYGVLIITPTEFIYQSLITGATNKRFTVDVNEDLFIAYGEIEVKGRGKWKYGDLKPCHITLRPIPHGMVRQFRFYDEDGLLEKVGEALSQVNRFDLSKHQ